jgi:hypothetical protein
VLARRAARRLRLLGRHRLRERMRPALHHERLTRPCVGQPTLQRRRQAGFPDYGHLERRHRRRRRQPMHRRERTHRCGQTPRRENERSRENEMYFAGIKCRHRLRVCPDSTAARVAGSARSDACCSGSGPHDKPAIILHASRTWSDEPAGREPGAGIPGTRSTGWACGARRCACARSHSGPAGSRSRTRCSSSQRNCARKHGDCASGGDEWVNEHAGGDSARD